MVLERQAGESKIDFHRRLVYGKLVDKTLADYDYSELAVALYGKEYSSDMARRMMYGSCKTLDILSDEIDSCSCGADGIDEKRMELQRERYKYFDQRNALNQILRERSRQEELNEILTRAITSGSLPMLEYVPVHIEPSDSDLLVSLNDLHYGACYSNYYGEYNSDICKSMMQEYLRQIIDITGTHRCENCIVWQNGDAISGSIHRSIQVTNKENVIEQLTGVSELIADFLAELSCHFATVSYVSVAGNHSRIEANKKDALLSERLDDLVEWYLRARLQNFGNVIIGAGEKIDPTMYVVAIRGKNYAGVHGDYEVSDSKIQSLQTMAQRPLYAVLLGHKHHNKIDTVQGIKAVMAGSFLGMDDYCIQKRIVGRPEQLVCVCDETGIRCSYDVAL